MTLEYFPPSTRWTWISSPLAPSPRILAYLARRASILQPNMMALTNVEPLPTPNEDPEIFVPPPEIITTPCDPWPRPYYLEDGLRKVHPYHFTYNTFCKQRWRGREILDIFATEFRDRPQEYYVRSVHIYPWTRLIRSRKTPLSVAE